MGAALAFLLMPPLIRAVGWRWTFVINGLLGGIWTTVWFLWFCDQPRQHPRVSLAECEYIEGGRQGSAIAAQEVPFAASITSSNMLLAMFQYIASNMTLFISVSWLFPYVASRWGAEAEYYTPIPLLIGAVALDLRRPGYGPPC